MLQAGYRQYGTCSPTRRMLSALVSGQPLHRQALPRFREAYSLVITHVCFHESEYSHLSPRTLGKLAKLVADKVSAGEKDPIRIRDEALADLGSKEAKPREAKSSAIWAIAGDGAAISWHPSY